MRPPDSVTHGAQASSPKSATGASSRIGSAGGNVSLTAAANQRSASNSPSLGEVMPSRRQRPRVAINRMVVDVAAVSLWAEERSPRAVDGRGAEGRHSGLGLDAHLAERTRRASRVRERAHAEIATFAAKQERAVARAPARLEPIARAAVRRRALALSRRSSRGAPSRGPSRRALGEPARAASLEMEP
jgi:hypothetical protein